MADFQLNKQNIDKLVKDMSKKALDGVEKELRTFHARQRGRSVASIQADYRRKFGKPLSEADARAYSEGVPLTVKRV
jgi:hypothetical protein